MSSPFAPLIALNERIRLRRSGRIFSRLGIVVMVCSLTLMAIATLYPHKWQIGPLVVSLRSFRGPLWIFIVGFALWYATVSKERASYQFCRRHLQWLLDEFRSLLLRLAEAWRNWDWRRRAFLVIAAYCVGTMVLHARRYPQHLQQDIVNRQRAVTRAECEMGRATVPSLEYFAQEIVAQTPSDARILFVGRTAGMRLAFEVYPRQVFMLPSDYRQMATSWHVQPWLRNPPEDRHESYWHQFMPIVPTTTEEFIREHQITHIARFDEMDRSACKLECLR